MQFRVLGRLEVRAGDGRRVRLSASKQRVLLGALLMSPNRTVPVDHLIDAVWSRYPPRSAPGVLRTYVSAVRRTLLLDDHTATTRLETLGGGYRLCVAPADLDLLRFDELAGAGHRARADGDLPVAVAALQEALALWRGHPLEDVPFEGRYEAERTRLSDRRRAALEAFHEARRGLHHARIGSGRT